MTPRSMDEQAIRALDGAGLTRLAWTLGLAPPPPPGLPTAWEGAEQIIFVFRGPQEYIPWEPHIALPQADAVFLSLRGRGWSTSVVWWADSRQYGEAWASCSMRSHSVRWPLDVPSEEHALLLTAVLVVNHIKHQGGLS